MYTQQYRRRVVGSFIGAFFILLRSLAYATTGDHRPFFGITIFADGLKAVFDGEQNPVYVAVDINGMYIINLKSSTWRGETFKLRVLVGSVAVEKTIVQAPWGSNKSD